MKTTELVSELKELGYFVERKERGHNSEYLAISTTDSHLIAMVSEKYYGVLNTDIYTGYNENQEHNVVFRMLIKYAMTPLDERGDTKKYLVKMLPVGDSYLNLEVPSAELSIADSDEMGDYQTEFTEEEYNELQSRYSQWLPVFDKDDQRFEEVGQ